MFKSDQDSVLAELSRTRAAYEDTIEPSERTQLRSRLDELRSDLSQLEGSGLAALSWEQLHDRVRGVRRRLDELASRRTAVDGRAELTQELALLLEEVERRRTPDPE